VKVEEHRAPCGERARGQPPGEDLLHGHECRVVREGKQTSAAAGAALLILFVGNLVVRPEASSECTCHYSMQCTIALIPSQSE